jgi:DNA-binding beta-propeller fold protein YncE
VFDATTESFIGTITVGSGPTGVAVSPDGKSVYVTNSHTGTAKDPGTVSIIQSGVLVATPVVGINPQGVAVMPSVPPTVITQPADQVVGVGNPATLTVQAAGSPPLAYQWYQGQSGDTTAPVAGATGSSFTTPALSVNITYWVQVINVAGNVNSNTATVTVASLPVCSVLNLQAAGGSPSAVAATAMCSDQLPLNTTLDWGDGTETSVSGGSIATSHTYPQQPPGTNSYNLQVKATNSLQVSGFKNGRLDLDPVLKQPVVVFQGQTASLPPVTLTSPNKQTFTVNFSCTTVVDSSNNPRPASQLGITCEALSQPITFTCTRTVCTSTPVTILIHTTGGATASLTPYGGSRSIFYAYLLPVAGVVFVFGGAFSGRRRRRLLGIFVLFSLQVMLGILTSCGGGFTTPKIVQNVTPAGTYRLTVVDNPVTSNDPAFEQTTLIVPLTVVPYQ